MAKPDYTTTLIGHMKTIDLVTIVIVTIYFANHPPTPASIQDFDFAGQAILRLNLATSVRRGREIRKEGYLTSFI